jgi:hypothetical protein
MLYEGLVFEAIGANSNKAPSLEISFVRKHLMLIRI